MSVETKTPVETKVTPLDELKAKLETAKELALAKAKARIETAQVEGQLALYSNDAYMDIVVKREQRTENVTKLQAIMQQLNSIPSVKLPEAGEIRINAFPVGERYFGIESALVLGIVQAVQSAFLDEHKLAVQTITGLSLATVEDFTHAFGQIAYWSKRDLAMVEEIPGNFKQALELLPEIADAMKLNALDLSKFTQPLYKAYFDNTAKRIKAKAEELEKAKKLDESEDFTFGEEA